MDYSAVQKDGSCNINGFDLTSHCYELSVEDFFSKGQRVDWILPNQEGQYTIYVGFISNKANFRQTSKTIIYTTQQSEQAQSIVENIVYKFTGNNEPSPEPTFNPTLECDCSLGDGGYNTCNFGCGQFGTAGNYCTTKTSCTQKIDTDLPQFTTSNGWNPQELMNRSGVSPEEYKSTLKNLQAMNGDKVIGWVWQDLGNGERRANPIYSDTQASPLENLPTKIADFATGGLFSIAAKNQQFKEQSLENEQILENYYSLAGLEERTGLPYGKAVNEFVKQSVIDPAQSIDRNYRDRLLADFERDPDSYRLRYAHVSIIKFKQINQLKEDISRYPDSLLSEDQQLARAIYAELLVVFTNQAYELEGETYTAITINAVVLIAPPLLEAAAPEVANIAAKVGKPILNKTGITAKLEAAAAKKAAEQLAKTAAEEAAVVQIREGVQAAEREFTFEGKGLSQAEKLRIYQAVDVSPGIVKDRIFHTITTLKQAFPKIEAEVFSTEGTSGVIYRDINNPNILYKVYDSTEFKGSTADFIDITRYAEEEAKKLQLLSNEGLAPKLIDYIPPNLTEEQKLLMRDPNFGFQSSKANSFPYINPSQSGRVADSAIVVMERVDIDPQGFAKLAENPAKKQAQIRHVLEVLQKYNLFPADTELVVDTGGNLKFIDLGGMSPKTGTQFANFSTSQEILQRYAPEMLGNQGFALSDPVVVGVSRVVSSQAEIIFSDLARVGTDKPLGYLPLNTIYQFGRTPEDLVSEAYTKGLKVILLRDGESRIRGGALYVYDEQALNALLRRNGNVLRQYGWPDSAGSFVYKSDQAVAPQKTPLFDLIADAYADYTNPLRRLPSEILSDQAVLISRTSDLDELVAAIRYLGEIKDDAGNTYIAQDIENRLFRYTNLEDPTGLEPFSNLKAKADEILQSNPFGIDPRSRLQGIVNLRSFVPRELQLPGDQNAFVKVAHFPKTEYDRQQILKYGLWNAQGRDTLIFYNGPSWERALQNIGADHAQPVIFDVPKKMVGYADKNVGGAFEGFVKDESRNQIVQWGHGLAIYNRATETAENREIYEQTRNVIVKYATPENKLPQNIKAFEVGAEPAYIPEQFIFNP